MANSIYNKVNINEPLDVENLKKLCERQKGEKFLVEQGHLKSMHIGQRILYKLFSSYRKEHSKEVKCLINGLTEKIRLTENAGSDEKEFVKSFYLETMASLSRSIYKRRINETVYKYLEKSQSTLSEKVSTICKDAGLYAKLGNYKKTTGGVGGSYCILKGKIKLENGGYSKKECLGIYKPFDEDTMAKNNPNFKQRIMQVFGKTIFSPFSRLAFQTVGGQGYVSEYATKAVERYVVSAVKSYLESQEKLTCKYLENLELVPDTEIAYIQLGAKVERIGSFQRWVNEKHETASEFLKTNRGYSAADDSLLPRELLDLLAIMDYVTSNFDRHADNWFVLKNDEDQVTGIRLIDGGWSMPPRHLTGWDLAEKKNLYLWKKLPSANEYFTDLGKFVIGEIFAQREELAKEIGELYASELSEPNWQRTNAMRERIEVLENVKKAKTKRELAEIQKEDQIKKVLTKKEDES